MTLKEIENIDFEKGNGIVPVIVQDSNSKDVLTLAYSNKESLELTKKTGNSWFWSRSRNKLWMKGEESGNTQKVRFRCNNLPSRTIRSSMSYRRTNLFS